MILLVAGLTGTNGCAGIPVNNVQNQVGYEKFFDSQGDERLIEKNNDLYLEKIDGSESRRITNTPKIKERTAYFSKNGRYIVYFDETISDGYGAYLVQTNEDDSRKIKISEDEARKLFYKD
jgi:Tol biopolymer transport system component